MSIKNCIFNPFVHISTCFWIFFLSLIATGCATQEKPEANNSKPTILKNGKKPNIIVILTDQERYPTHWPEGWAEKNLISNNRLSKNGIFFTKAYTAASECTPSRAVLTTSEHYPINKVPSTPSKTGLPSGDELMDIGSLLKKHTEYDVVWKGKWHLSPPLKGGYNWTEKDIANIQEKYDLYGWTPPDAGNAIMEIEKNVDGTFFDGLSTLGGGYANNDFRYLYGSLKKTPKETPGWGEGILDYLKKAAAKDSEERKPFCLFISLVNPHDVWVYPTSFEKAGYKKEDFANMGIDLPPNFKDDLKTKPSVQLKAREAYNKQSPLNGPQAEKEYVNFYAYLNKKIDESIVKILDTLDETGLTDDTIIIRTADHGELGLSHGMREKAYTVYEEMTHIPLIISNPQLFPNPKTTDAFYCHLDLLPTIAELTGVPEFAQYGKGVSIVPILNNEVESVQDSILFTYDDNFFLPEDVPGGHIRAIRKGDWVYAVYYSADGSHFEYEMYDLKNDPGQLHNLLYKDVSPENASQANKLHRDLKEKIDQAEALPVGFPWPEKPF
ncbi:sulfatase-like hydrolase/transferase [Criblamydia sequanensis]|uniref:Sulfatase n=1 Tax=Candidatus Criblamydia sequanensis CRIB-18 TaxID=1437425 RepID=A0A090D205_9BACT|nr:sulfatase-like hydrolase/transferase [Criblamydia sequanensis]CDR34210.1 Sulfatase [Criblamydia sequanensis CRIB-18]